MHGVQSATEHIKAEGRSYSIVVLSYPEIMHSYAPLIRAYMPNAQLIYDTVDLHGIRLHREALTKNNDINLLEKAKTYEQMECANLESADLVIAVTDTERSEILKRVPDAKVQVIPNIHSIIKETPPFESRQGLLFIGHYLHSPNEDAIFYFVDEILPQIKEQLGSIPFFILGSSVTGSMKRVESDTVHIIGYVEDPVPWFNKTRVFVAPLRYGAGMKGKIGQSLGLGLPAVTTSIGAEGMMLENGKHVLIADNPTDFANEVIKLYQDPVLWNKLAEQGRLHISQHFSETAARGIIQKVFSSK